MPRVATRRAVPSPTGRLFDVVLGDTANAVAWCPGGDYLAAASLAGTVHVIDRTGAERTLSGKHDGGALCVSWSPDGKTLCAGGSKGRVFIYDHSFSLLHVETLGERWVEHIAWSPDGSCFAVQSGSRVGFFTRSGRSLGTPITLPSTITALAWHRATSRVIATCYGGVHFLEAGRPLPVRTLEWKGSILTACASPDGRWLATGNQDSSVHIWELSTGSDLEMSGYPAKVTALSWGEGGPLLATAGVNVITVWSFSGKGPAGSTPVELSGHQARITALAFTARGQRLLSTGDDGVFHVADRKPTWRSAFADATEAPLVALCVSDDATLAAAAQQGGRVLVWRLA